MDHDQDSEVHVTVYHKYEFFILFVPLVLSLMSSKTGSTVDFLVLSAEVVPLGDDLLGIKHQPNYKRHIMGTHWLGTPCATGRTCIPFHLSTHDLG